MKKIVLIGALVGTLASMSAFGQGFFTFSGSSRAVWDDTNLTPRNDTSNMVAFLWAPQSSVAAVSGIQASVATNAVSTPGTAWQTILGESNFHFATNSGTGALVTQQTAANGGFLYLSGGGFGVTGTSANVTYTILIIGWNTAGGLYTNPFAAAAAGQALGWAATFEYTSKDAPPLGSPGTMVFGAFGVAPVPEPTSLALAGLGIASLLVFRRRNK